jgi:hypothetical protein
LLIILGGMVLLRHFLWEERCKLTVGTSAKQLAVLDSLLITGSSTQLTLSDSTSLTTPRLIGRSSAVVTYGKGLTLNVPQMWMDGNASLITETNLSFANATDFKLTNWGILDNRRTATFSIPRFEADNIVSGYFKNWGTLNVLSDSIVVNSGVTLEESGLLSADDSLSRMRVLGIVSHGLRYYALSYDTYADSGLVFKIGELVIESGGKIDVTGMGYRGRTRDGWTGSRSETYPGYLGASGCSGGSHGGLGGLGTSGDAGNVYDVVEDPFALGAGGSTGDYPYSGSGGNGGGLIRIEADVLTLNGQILANGQSPGGYYSGGGAGGSINLRVRQISGSGTVQTNGGSGGVYSGGGGGGRIAIRWQEGDINSLTITTQGGTGDIAHGGQNGNPGTTYTYNGIKKAQR